MGNMVANVYAKSDYDRLCNEKASGFRTADNDDNEDNNKNPPFKGQASRL